MISLQLTTHTTKQLSLKRPCLGLLFFGFGCLTTFSQTEKGLSETLTASELKQIDSIVSVLSLDEKAYLLRSNSLFTSGGVERLGIREMTYDDGPSGIREEVERNNWKSRNLTTDSATFFPTGTALAATWNPEMAYINGIGMGEEARTRCKDVLLAPSINIIRTPLCGRNYEYMSEDPLLTSIMVVPFIKGIQKSGTMACIKHYAANNQEVDRGKISAEMNERTLREIYLPGFKAAITEAKSHTLMTAYNRVNGEYCSENRFLIDSILRKEWKFDGIVVSDWGGTHNTKISMLYGLDLEMGVYQKNCHYCGGLIDSIKEGKIPESALNEKAKRVLMAIFHARKKDNLLKDSILSTAEHNKIAYDIASQSIVLLKNEKNILPIDITKTKSIAVIGYNATSKNASGGFGAGVKARFEITPLEGLKNRIGNKVTISYAKGYETSFYKDTTLALKRRPDNKLNPELIAEAVETAHKSDIAIVFIGSTREVESEGGDRLNLDLPFGENELVKAVYAANPKTIVVVVAGTSFDMSTANTNSQALLYSWFNGSQAGNALADVLIGKVNPSGKLPFTFPAKLEDSPAHALNAYPGNGDKVEHKEGILVGYRWFDTKNITPQYCFGYGLSYSEFKMSNLKTDKSSYKADENISVSLKLNNIGKFDGYETVQLYVSELNPKVEKVVKELKAFKKVFVEKGKDDVVQLNIKAADLAYFDETAKRWIVSPGKYKLLVGSSSRNIEQETEIEIK